MAYTDRDLSNLTISESFWRLMQTDPVDDRTLIDGTGSLVTHLTVSGTVEAYYFKGDGSQLENLPTSSLPAGLVSSSAQLGLSPSDSPTFANLTIDGKITAQEFHTEYVSASIIYESGSTKFGDTLDDIHSFTGSLQVNGSITGSLFGTASNSDFSTTSSYIDPLFISASVVALGLSGASEWDEVQNKPSGLVSSSAQTIANLFGTNIVSGSGQRDILGLAETDSPTFANGNFTGNLLVDGTLTARTYVVSSSVVDYQTIQVSGSTKFGDTLDDRHEFTGSIDVLGSITGSLQGTASYALTASYAENANFDTGSFATTASNVFFGNQVISGSLEVSGTTTLYGNIIPGAPYGVGNVSNYSLGTPESVWNDLWVSGQSIHIVSSSGEVANIKFSDGVVSFTTNGDTPAVVSLGTIFVSGSDTLTGSLDITGSLILTGSAEITENLTVFGRITAQEFYTELVSSSIIYESGSTKFGDTLDDTHQFTGSVNITGSLSLSDIAYFNTLFVTNSYVSNNLYVTGSTIFGNSLNTTHQFTGSVTITGSLKVDGELILPSTNELPIIFSTGSLIISASSAYLYL